MEGSIVVLDFGGQYAHLIASRMRRFGYASEIRLAGTPAPALKGAAGIILSGGPQSVYEKGSPQADPKIFDLAVPILGICYGQQWIAHALGGEVKPGTMKEYGHTTVTADPSSSLFSGLPQHFVVWMSHGDEVKKLPRGFKQIASSENCANAAFSDEKRRIFAVQFHLEVTHTEHGFEILKRFAELCHPAPWSMRGYGDHISRHVREAVGDRNVFMLVSGGVDSTVAFTLLNKVLGAKRVHGLLIDTGLMRKNEVKDIKHAFHALGIRNLHVEDASEEFFANLKDIYDPEEKRRVIGATFLSVQRRVFEELGLENLQTKNQKLKTSQWVLGQGTIYPDTIETGGTKHADQIKTHHNRVEAITALIEKGLVIEPLKELYKDEVRTLGEEIGLPHDFVWRHPFPGPGLGVRILCAKQEVRDQASEVGLKMDVPHTVLPIRSVGVQGDGRTYRHAVVLFGENLCAPTKQQWQLATSIPNSMPTINRVLVCTSHIEPVECVLTPSFITLERADLLREADAIVDHEMRRAGLYESIWQFPVVLLPLGTRKGGSSIVLRPVESTEAMTANAAHLPEQVLRRMTERLLKLPGIDLVFYDLTNKPPATIEWE